MSDVERKAAAEAQEYTGAEFKSPQPANERSTAICPSCNADLESDSRYCPECGATTSEGSNTCAVCGGAVLGAFCDSCGASLVPVPCPSCGQPEHFPFCTSCGSSMSPVKEEQKTEVVVVDCTADGPARLAVIDLLFSDEEKKLREKLEHRAIILREKKYFVEREARIEKWRASGKVFFEGPTQEDLALAKMMSANLFEFGRQWQARKNEEERLAQAKAEEERVRHEELLRLRRAAEEAERRRKAAEETARQLQTDKATRESADREAALREAQERELKLRQEAADAQKIAQAAAIQQRNEVEVRARETAKKQKRGFSGRWIGANNTTGHYECLEIVVGDTSFSANLYSSSPGLKSVEHYRGSINPPNIQLTCYKYDVLYCPSNALFSYGHFSGRLSNDLRTLTGVWTYPVTGRRSQVMLTRSG